MRMRVEKLVNGGAGMGTIEGKAAFVPLSAPGDLLDVEVTADHGGWLEASIVRIEEPAVCRVAPRCPVFGVCGGCQWQHISYEEQLKWKREILRETLARIGREGSPEVLETMASPRQWNYRNRIQLHVDSRGRIGFYRPRSKAVVEFAECAIADEALNAELNARRAELSKRDRGIALRLDDGTGSFVQINSGQNDNLRRTLVEWLGGVPHGTVCELYAGSGNFTFDIARIADAVFATDIDRNAVDAARARQQREGIANVEFMAGEAPRALKRMQGSCDALVLDPPRKGCAEAVAAIVELKPRSILYISCDPATLARDLVSLKAHGYRLVKALPVDMFPQTHHIESLTLIARD